MQERGGAEFLVSLNSWLIQQILTQSSALSNQVCKHCGTPGTGNYCNNCGQSFQLKRITVAGIIHEIFHLFTHFDKGFVYTFKKLVTNPGIMQKEYLEGHRIKHQKPFSMFFICATVAALIFYWINRALITYYEIGDQAAASFFQHYMVMLQIVLLPIYAGISRLIFYDSKYNYAEIIILLLYMLSVALLFSALIQLLRFIWPDLETRFIELPVILAYGIITNNFFFDDGRKWITIVKSAITIAACFLLAGFIQDWLIEFLF